MPRDEERRVRLLLWRRDGALYEVPDGLPAARSLKQAMLKHAHDADAGRKNKVEIGRTDSKRRLGFLVLTPGRKEITDFALDREQVKALRDYLDRQVRRLKR